MLGQYPRGSLTEVYEFLECFVLRLGYKDEIRKSASLPRIGKNHQ
jgi:hypothetical protein